MDKESFKNFVRNNIHLADFVENKKMTWQQFYELYDLYGEESSVWDKFKSNSSNNETKSNNNLNNIGLVATIKEIYNLLKGIDLETVQKALTTADKAIDAFKGLSKKEDNIGTNFEERPKYKYFED